MMPEFLPGITLAPLDNGLVSVLTEDQREAEYDRIAWLYDAVIGNGWYNRLVWGLALADYDAAARAALAGAKAADHKVLDCGCGSLVFTSSAYRALAPDGIVLVDRSLAMLRRARGRWSGGLAIQGDALALPFADGVFDRTLAWGLAHLFGSKAGLFDELARVTRAGGAVHCSALVQSGRLRGDSMLRALVRRGEAAASEAPDAFITAFGRHFAIQNQRLKGNMLFLSGIKG